MLLIGSYTSEILLIKKSEVFVRDDCTELQATLLLFLFLSFLPVSLSRSPLHQHGCKSVALSSFQTVLVEAPLPSINQNVHI